MDRRNQRPWDESQVEATEVSDDVVVNKTSSAAQTRTRKSFPSRFEGRDGDAILVSNNTGTFECRKVLGKWLRTRLGGA